MVPQIRLAIAAGETERAAALLRSLVTPGLDLTQAHTLHRLLRQLRAASPAPTKVLRVALLSSFTVSQLTPIFDLFLFAAGIHADLYVPDYGTFRQEILDSSSPLYAAAPAVVVFATGWRDLVNRPALGQQRAETEGMVRAEVEHWSSLWQQVHDRLGCQIVQNNFDSPPWRPLGNHDPRDPSGLDGYIARLNIALQDAAPAFVTIHDLDHLAASHGRWTWGEERYFYLAKIPCAPECQVDYAHSLASLLIAQQGGSRKCLVLDLDNTLWGGVVGDDGLAGIRLGQGDAEGEAFVAFQLYAKSLRARGVLLAVCSKNEAHIAKEAFDKHPGMALAYDDISCFVANWTDKATNLRSIAERLNIGLNSLVFVDDNPAERALVRQLLPEVAVPELGTDPADYIRCVEQHRYFQTVSTSPEDFQRAEYYRANAAREMAEQQAGGLGDFLASLAMVADVAPVDSLSLERSTQLINKSNQFNLTTRRYTAAEVLGAANDPSWVTLTASLKDRFGDNGLITVLLARIDGAVMDVDTWLMSCRVLKRGVEQMLLEELVDAARRRGARRIRGTYLPTAKNALVARHYPDLGFKQIEAPGLPAGATRWELELEGREPTPTFIEVRRRYG
jgi:FkbH-like protein